MTQPKLYSALSFLLLRGMKNKLFKKLENKIIINVVTLMVKDWYP